MFLTMIPKHWRGAFLVFLRKQEGTILSFLFFFFYHTFHGQKNAMYDYVTFLFPFTDEWLERSGWMGRNGHGQGGSCLIGLETRSKRICKYITSSSRK